MTRYHHSIHHNRSSNVAGYSFWPRTLIMILASVAILLVWKFLSLTKDEGEYSVDLTPLRHPASRTENVTILVVINSDSNIDEYRYSLPTIVCYAKIHNYTLRVVNDSDYLTVCRQTDYMFRRHCIAAMVLEQSEWLLFLDADIGVINPKRLIEEYIDAAYDLTFYDRFTSWEVAMGSYLARRSEFSVDFLRQFADYEDRLPKSFHGTDNGAIHAFLVERLLSHSMTAAEPCLNIWKQSKGWDDLFLYEACIRSIMGARSTIDRLRIIPKGRGWVRDIWLTDSHWSPQRDFMLHGMKASDRLPSTTGFLTTLQKMFMSRFAWQPIFQTDLRIEECTTASAWLYDENLRVAASDIELALRLKHREVERRRWQEMARVAPFI